MKIFIINSSAFLKKEEGFFVYKSTGEFLVELSELNNDIEIFHYYIKSLHKSSLISQLNVP